MATSMNPPRPSWQEVLSNWQTVPAAHVSQAAEVIRGLAGSWAASRQVDASSRNFLRSDEAGIPSPQVQKVLKIGQPGFPEINFAPYNWGTNRFGSKGGSFIGHPISFSVVGPTAKNSLVNSWQWTVADNSATPGLGDKLFLNQAGAVTVADLYDIPSGAVTTPGGLYLLVSQTGEAGALNGSVVGGIGDGCVVDDALIPTGYEGIRSLAENSKFEIFRVVSTLGDSVTLDPSKRLATYFTIPVGFPVVKAVTFIKPEATRLVAVPGTTTGTAKDYQAFAVVPPRRALGTDEKVPASLWKTSPGPWAESALSADLGTGTSFTYQHGPKLPIPRPVGEWHGRLHGIEPVGGTAEGAVVTPAGTFILHAAPSPGYTGDLIGKVLKIHSIESRLSAVLSTDLGTGYQANLNSVLGSFEVVDSHVTPDYWIVRRLEECDLNTGFSRTGGQAYFTVDSGVHPIGKGIFVEATVHEVVTDLWATRYTDIDKLLSARLTNIIDPLWTERSLKSSGETPDRADKSVFDTSRKGNQYSNPGSLLDLGFRMVVFPAKVGAEPNPAGGPDIEILVPDWDNPVDSSEILLDPSKPNENQFLEVDYSNGLVQFSHPIKSGSPLYPTDPAVFTSTDNVRGEMVLFACCVPYSQEEGQLGANMRVLGSVPSSVDYAYGDDTAQAKDTVDAFSNRLVLPAFGVQSVASTHIVDFATPANQVQVIVVGNWTHSIPQVGFFEMLNVRVDGNPVISSAPSYRGSLFGYTSVVDYHTLDATVPANAYTVLQGVFGGGVYGVSSFTSTMQSDLTASAPAVVVIRREVATPNDLFGDAGVPYQFDTTYGSAKRSTSLRFDDADLVAGADGSMLVRARGTQTQNIQSTLGDVFSSCVLLSNPVLVSGATISTWIVHVPTHTILMQGHRQAVPATDIEILQSDGTYYIYYQHNDGRSIPLCLASGLLPLYHPEDILLAKVVVSGGSTVTTVTQLQNPLKDVDRRVDIYVGELGYRNDQAPYPFPLNQWNTFTPHFPTLWQAVEYANNLMWPDVGMPQLVHIKVVGRTYEPAAHLPIVIKTPGLIIEGIPFNYPDPTVVTTAEIAWGTNGVFNYSLIDLNGQRDLVFRDLSFRSAAKDVTHFGAGTANVFTNTNVGAFLSGLIIDNCRSVGFIQHFISLENGVGLTNSHITNNNVINLMGNAVADVRDSSLWNTVDISGNTFQNDSVRVSTGIEVHASTTPLTTFMDAPNVNMGISIQGNTLLNFGRGIWVAAMHGVIADNHIDNTKHEGIVSAGNWEIRNNNLTSIYTGTTGNFEGSYTPNTRHGIRHYSTHLPVGELVDSVFSGKIIGNRVEMYGDGTTLTDRDKGILVSGSPNPIAVTQHTGTAGGGGPSTITLDGGASVVDGFYVGCVVTFTNDSPAGVGVETGTITGYVGGTQVATVSAPWATQPDNTSNFKVARFDRLGTAFHEIVEGNDLSYQMGQSSSLARPNIRVEAVGAKVSGNICNYLEVWGNKNTVSENQVGQLGINWDIYNQVANPHVDVSDTNIVSKNVVAGDSFLWSGTTALGNKFSDFSVNGVTYVRNYCVLNGNSIEQLEDFDGVGAGPVTGSSVNLMLTGNKISQLAADHILDLSIFEMVGNTLAADLSIPDVSNAIISDNLFEGAVSLGSGAVASTHFTVSGNRFSAPLLIGTAGHPSVEATVTGNHSTDSLVLHGDTASLANNITMDFETHGSQSNMSANNTQAFTVTGDGNNLTGNNTLVFTVNGSDNAIMGNNVTNLVVAGATNIIQGNRFFGSLTLTAGGGNTYNMVSNNIGSTLAGPINVNTNYTVLTGNVCSGITFNDSLTGAMLSGNMVNGDVILGNAVGTQTTEVVLSGNWVAGSVLPNVAPSSIIAMGNKAAVIMDTAVHVGKVVNTADNSNV